VTCPRHGTQDAVFWVGIDGFTSGTVEQDGTLAECNHGAAFYFTWWEMFPANSIQVAGSSVSPGDAISSSVVRSGTSYTLKVTDSTHPANSFSPPKAAPPAPTPAPSGSRRRRAAAAKSSRLPTSAPGPRRARP
jgi:Peptidase A4 family.